MRIILAIRKTVSGDVFTQAIIATKPPETSLPCPLTTVHYSIVTSITIIVLLTTVHNSIGTSVL